MYLVSNIGKRVENPLIKREKKPYIDGNPYRGTIHWFFN